MNVNGQNLMLAQHLVLLIHGLHGHANDLLYAGTAISEYHGQQVVVLAPEVNHGLTHRGIVPLSERLYEWLLEQLKSHPNAKYISMVGHSLGGLVARRLCYLLRRDGILPNQLTPISFITIATPHLGSRHHGRMIFGWPLINIGCFVARVAAGKTGAELFLLDHDTDPLLLKMTDDDHLEALRLFRRRIAYANVRFDLSVAFPTSAIFHHNPYRRIASADRKTLLMDFKHDSESGVKPEIDTMEELIRTRLDALGWQRRVFVAARPMVAHLDIMVTDSSRSKHGGVVIDDVVQHLLLDQMDPADSLTVVDQPQQNL